MNTTYINDQPVISNPSQSGGNEELLSISSYIKKYFLCSILPYDTKQETKAILSNRLKEYSFLLEVSRLATENLLRRKFSAFDPLVGENACQIRAIKNSIIFSKYPVNAEDLLKNILNIQKKIESAVTVRPDLLCKNITLDSFLQDQDLKLSLTYSELYLIKSFLLTQVKTLRPPKPEAPFIKNEYTNPKKLKEIAPIGTMFAENLVKKTRKTISKLSTLFTRELARTLTFPESIVDSVSDKFSVCHRGLHCLPCYPSTLIAVFKALQENIPIVLVARQLNKSTIYEVIEETVIYFKSENHTYHNVPENQLNQREPALVLLGNAFKKKEEHLSFGKWIEKLLSHSPIDLLLAYASSHRQYPNDINHEIEFDDQRYIYYRKNAENWGCSIDNPSLFFLSHALCDTLGNCRSYVEANRTNKKILAKIN